MCSVHTQVFIRIMIVRYSAVCACVCAHTNCVYTYMYCVPRWGSGARAFLLLATLLPCKSVSSPSGGGVSTEVEEERCVYGD